MPLAESPQPDLPPGWGHLLREGLTRWTGFPVGFRPVALIPRGEINGIVNTGRRDEALAGEAQNLEALRETYRRRDDVKTFPPRRK